MSCSEQQIASAIVQTLQEMGSCDNGADLRSWVREIAGLNVPPSELRKVVGRLERRSVVRLLPARRVRGFLKVRAVELV